MGLTIHYAITGPSLRSGAAALVFLREAHQQIYEITDSRRLGFMTSVFNVNLDDACVDRRIQVEKDGGVEYHTVEPNRGATFYLYPGPDCNEALLGLCEYPASVRLDGKKVKTHLPRWWFQGYCKTQYASIHGWDNFFACHRLVIDSLLVFKKLGCTVEIQDEGHYWPGRNEARLREELDLMNRLIAGLGGAFKDGLEGSQGSVFSPIFAHPRFEQLEAEGRALQADRINKLSDIVCGAQ